MATRRGHNRMPAIQKITTFLWFDNNAEEAINFYVSVFKNSKLISLIRHGEAGPGPKGTVLGATFQLEGQQFFALNGGPKFKFTEAISLFVSCETQEEIDTSVGAALRRRLARSLRLAQRQVRSVLANRPLDPAPTLARSRYRNSRPCHARHDANGQTRHSGIATGTRPTLVVLA